jgi:hypothetical protein
MQKGIIRAGLWIAGIFALTAFSRPLANGGEAITRSLTTSSSLGCAKCSDGENTHSFSGSGAYFDCATCNSCHSNTQSGWCGDYHCNCGTDEDELVNGAALSIQTFAQLGETSHVSDVAALLARHPNRLQYNAGRGVLQLLSCDSKVIAQISVDDAVTAALD